MANMFLVVRKLDSRMPQSDGIDAVLTVAASAAAARTAAEAITPGDPPSSWAAAHADVYDLNGTTFATGLIGLGVKTVIVPPAT